MPLKVRRIQTKSDKKKFIRLLWDIYTDDPNWVPPLMMDRMKLIDEVKNPFYKHADVAWFLAEDNGKAVGRIAAIVNHNHNKYYSEQAGFFGFFESIDREDVARMLFLEAESFLRSKGMTVAYGPANPSSNDEYGLLVEGFDRPPVLLMTYNPLYYTKLIEQNGYTKWKDLYAWRLSQETALSDKLKRVSDIMRTRSQISVRTFDPKQFNREVETIKEIYNKAWEKNSGFVPFTDEEMDFLAADLKQIYEKELALFAEKDAKAIGFCLALPDINQAFHAGPRIPSGLLNLPIGLWNLLTKKKAIDTARIVILGVLPEYRGKGVDAVLYRETMERARRKGYMFGEASWVLEDNIAMNRAAEMMNGEKYKTYRVYQKSLV